MPAAPMREADDTRPALEVGGLDAWYGAAQILFDVALEVGPGEAVALLGRNGAGKTTVLKAIAGLVPRRAGRILFGGRDLVRLPIYAIVRTGLGYVPEDRRIFVDLTVAENLEVGRRPARAGAPPWTPERLYDLFPALGSMRTRKGGQMSGGEQQMLAIARTLMGNPRLVLLDEIAEGLAPKLVEEMVVAILAMKRDGLGLVLSEQNPSVARMLCERAVILDKGRTRFAGTMAALDADPAARDALLTP